MLDVYDSEEVLHRISSRSGEPANDPEGDTLADWSAEGEGGAALEDAADDPRILDVIGQVSEGIIAEVKRTFEFYQSQTMLEHFDAIFLSGGGAHIGDLAQRLEERLGWPVERFEPLRRVNIREKSFDRDYVWQTAPQAAVAFGLALRGVVQE